MVVCYCWFFTWRSCLSVCVFVLQIIASINGQLLVKMYWWRWQHYRHGNLTPFTETQENVINIGTLQGRLIGQQSCRLAIQVRFQRCSQLFRIVECRADFLDVWWHILNHARLTEWWNSHSVAGLRSGDQKGGEANEYKHLAWHAVAFCVYSCEPHWKNSKVTVTCVRLV